MSEELNRAISIADENGSLMVKLAAAIVADDESKIDFLLAAIKANQADVEFEFGLFSKEGLTR
jgi:hypothetical protein